MTTQLCPHELETIKQFITPGDVVFDIGANEGIWTSAALMLKSFLLLAPMVNIVASLVRLPTPDRLHASR
jgi:hypothetical protein